LIKKLIAFHPSYNEQKPNELKNVSCPTLIQWVKQDMWHNLKKWKVNIDKIPKAKTSFLEVKMFKRELSYNAWQSLSDKLMVSVVEFLTGVDVTKKKQDVTKALEESKVNTKGQNVKEV
jgi:hypothetical protein